MENLKLELAGIKLKNPVMVASGTFGYGEEFNELIDLNRLGAIITKTVTLKSKAGNPPPRTTETAAGMLNSIGLQNEGVDHLISHYLPFLKSFDTPVIVNIAGETIEEYAEVARRLKSEPVVKGIEINISCPNVKKGGMVFGCDPQLTKEVVSAVRKATSLPLIVKLTPNVTDIAAIAKSAVEAGADAISLINTLLGMAIDVKAGKPKLATYTGGLSGPAIKPVAVRMVWQVYQAVKVPIIGMGGIMNTEDALEFILAGASAVAVGTASFINPKTAIEIIEGLEDYLEKNKIKDIKELVGRAAR
jgi:dihydroorotate dehydrogenase (NAD+) catalytic subunit